MSRHFSSYARARLSLFYFASALAACISAGVAPGSIPFRIVKVTPLLLLCIGRFVETRERLATFVGLGFFASFIGDLVIDSNFVAGLGAFLIAHVLFLVAMGLPKPSIGSFMAAIPAVTFGSMMWWQLVGTGNAPLPLHTPITAYAIIISAMFGRAIDRAFVDPKDSSARTFLLGATLFVLSDTLIGVNRWVVPVHLARVWILVLYFTGQYFIFRGSMPTPATSEQNS